MEKTGNAGNELAELRQLCQELSLWAFTDYKRARPALERLQAAVTPKTPFDIRLSYHRYAAFLENQWQHFGQLNRVGQTFQDIDSLGTVPERLIEVLPLIFQKSCVAERCGKACQRG